MILTSVRMAADQISQMSDTELRVSIAREYQGFDHVHMHPSGAISVRKDGVLTELPVYLPDWPNSAKAMAELEDDLREDGLWEKYSRSLEEISGGMEASPRQRCEAVLATVRANS